MLDSPSLTDKTVVMSSPVTQQRIAENVRVELARQHRSQAEIAAQLNKNALYVSRRVRGVVPFHAHELDAIARLLDVPVDRFYEDAVPA